MSQYYWQNRGKYCYSNTCDNRNYKRKDYHFFECDWAVAAAIQVIFIYITNYCHNSDDKNEIYHEVE